ncbi:glutathione S-transferase 1-1-like [Culicoides brevitarsis]|uniref:glutathione S-transferase 1-1-like n=1 Tax=Culicoides brevitarsis TaxID=469753 RepID=UPI00307C7500
MAPVTIYWSERSPVSRVVVFLAHYLKIEAEYKKLDLEAKDQLQDWFLKINPQHTVPVLVDGDLILTQSRAILTYLASKNSAGSVLYPSCPKKRAIIDCRLYFDATVLAARSSYLGRLIQVKGVQEVTPEDRQFILDGYNYLNDFLKGNKWVTGDQLTVADFALFGSVSIFYYLKGTLEQYTEIQRWYKQFESFEGYDKFLPGAQGLAQYINAKLPNGF